MITRSQPCLTSRLSEVSILLVILWSRWQRQEGLLDFYILEEILDKVTFPKRVHDFTDNTSQFVLKV